MTGRKWTAEEIGKLGTAPDAKVAEQLSRSLTAVKKKRKTEGIAPFKSSRDLVLKKGRVKLSSGWFCTVTSAEKQFRFSSSILSEWRKGCSALPRNRKITFKRRYCSIKRGRMRLYLYAEAVLREIRKIWDHAENGGNGWPTIDEVAQQIGMSRRAIDHWIDNGRCPYLPKKRAPQIDLDFRLTPVNIKKVRTLDPDDVATISDARKAETNELLPQAFVMREYRFTQRRLGYWSTKSCPALDGELLYREKRLALKKDGRPLEQWHYRRSEIETIKTYREGGSKQLRAGRMTATQFAKKFRVSPDTVRDLLRGQNLEPVNVIGPGGETEMWRTADANPILKTYIHDRDSKQRERGRALALARHTTRAPSPAAETETNGNADRGEMVETTKRMEAESPPSLSADDIAVLQTAHEISHRGDKPTAAAIAKETKDDAASGAFKRRLIRLSEEGHLKNLGRGRGATGYILTSSGKSKLQKPAQK